MLDKLEQLCYNKDVVRKEPQEREEKKMFIDEKLARLMEIIKEQEAEEEKRWQFIQEVSVAGVSYKEYISIDGKHGRMVYNDGYEEIYEIS